MSEAVDKEAESAGGDVIVGACGCSCCCAAPFALVLWVWLMYLLVRYLFKI